MKAIVLFSGGLDSSLVLALALKAGRSCIALSFDYGQRHRIELEAAKAIAEYYGVPHRIIKIDVSAFSKSALVDHSELPKNRSASQIANEGIPSTYVPARNTLFLAYATAQAEICEAGEIHVGFNSMDRLPYPDCRKEYLDAFQSVLNLATKQAVEGNAPKIIAPLINWDKNEIAKQAIAINLPIDKTFSCYDPTPAKQHCGACDACVLRRSALQFASLKPFTG